MKYQGFNVLSVLTPSAGITPLAVNNSGQIINAPFQSLSLLVDGYDPYSSLGSAGQANFQATAGYVFNGLTWDRIRTGLVADNSNSRPNIGVAQVQLMGYPANGNVRPYVMADSVGDANGAGGALPTIQLGVIGSGSYDRLRYVKTYKPQVAVAINPEATVWTPAAGKKFRVMRMVVTSSVVGDIVFKDNTAGTTVLVVSIGVAGTPCYVDFGNGYLSTAANNVLTATGPALSTLSGTIMGTEE